MIVVRMWTGQRVRALRKDARRETQEEFAEKIGVSVHAIRKWENATATKPLKGRAAAAMDTALMRLDEPQMARFHAALATLGPASVGPDGDSLDYGLADDLDTGTVAMQDPSSGGDESVERKNFLQLLTGSIAGMAFIEPMTEQAATGIQVGVSDVVRIRRQARALARQDHQFGGELSAPGAVTKLGAAASLVYGSFSRDSVRRDYLVALAELADTTAGVCFDAGLHLQAKCAFRFAVGCAIEAEDVALRAKALTGLANLAVHQNHLDDALTYAEMALVRNDLLPTKLQAVVHTRHARALGCMGAARSRECVGAVLRGEDAFGADDGRTPDWIAYYDHAHLRRDSGRALLYLSMRGGDNFHDAYARLNSALAEFPTGFSRGKALTTANLATLVMARDDPHHAVELGKTALDSIGDVQSDRVNHAIGQLSGACSRHPDLPDVIGLREHIRTAVPTAVYAHH